MAGMAEFSLAVCIADEFLNSGSCNHSSLSYQPISLTAFEASELEKFDPELLGALKDNGVTVEIMTIADYDYIGTKIGEILRHKSYDSNIKSKKLHKHALSRRLNKTLLSLNSSSERTSMEHCSRIFTHRLICY